MREARDSKKVAAGSGKQRRSSKSGRWRSRRVYLPVVGKVKRKNLFRAVQAVGTLLALFVGGLWTYQYLERHTVTASLSGQEGEEMMDVPMAPKAEKTQPRASLKPDTAALLHQARLAEIRSELTSLSLTGDVTTRETRNFVLEFYQSASGMSGVQSLLLHGTYEEEGRIFDMQLAAKAPCYVKKTLTDASIKIVSAWDGKSAKIQVDKGVSGVALQQLEEGGLYASALKLEGAFLALSEPGQLGADSIRLEGKLWPIDGRACCNLIRGLPDGTLIYHFIDLEYGLERARRLEFELSGQTHELMLHFTDYKNFGLRKFPQRYILKLDGKVRGVVRVENPQVNPGLMPWNFSLTERL